MATQTREIRQATQRLLQHLHRCGIYAHLWTDAGHRSYWFRVDEGAPAQRRVPLSWRRHNIYFTVHPLTQIPPLSGAGRTDPRHISSQLPYIAAVNALFAEYDGKDSVEPIEYSCWLPDDWTEGKPAAQRQAIKAAKERAFYREPECYKSRVWAAIQRLSYQPSVIVDSGGGYHCYWLLRDPVPIDDANRADVQTTQHTWVQMVHADPGASDLRRVLWLPGSHNHKAGFGPHAPLVTIIKADFDLLYDYRELEGVTQDWLYAQRLRRTVLAPKPMPEYSSGDGLRSSFNATHSIVDLLTAHGYRVGYVTPEATRLARPSRERSDSSVTVFPARADGGPELSVHFSTNDELYSEENIDETTGQVRRRAHDAFYIYVVLEHGGDWRAAYAAVRERALDAA